MWRLKWPVEGHPVSWWCGQKDIQFTHSGSLSSSLNVLGSGHLQIRLWKYNHPHLLNDKASLSFFFFPPRDNPRHLWFEFLLQQEPSDDRRAAFLQDMAYANCSLNSFPCPSCWIPQTSSCYFFSKDKASAAMTGRLFHKNERSCVIIISEHWVIFLDISNIKYLLVVFQGKRKIEEGLFLTWCHYIMLWFGTFCFSE